MIKKMFIILMLTILMVSNVSAECSDSDKGKDYYYSGTVTADSVDYADSCNGDVLTENYCNEDVYTSVDYTCPHGCENNVCKFRITCTVTGQLMEGDTQSYTVAETDYSIRLSYAEETEAMFHVDDVITSSISEGEYDVIVTGTKLYVFNVIEQNPTTDWATFCIEQNYCTDSDGGKDYYTKGYIESTESDGEKIWDICPSTEAVTEIYCEGTSYEGEIHACEFGCVDGACLEEAPVVEDPVEPPVEDYPVVEQEEDVASYSVCTDSDGGKDYYEKGTATFFSESGTDACSTNKNSVTENYCAESGIAKVVHECFNGCEDGACLETNVTSSVIKKEEVVPEVVEPKLELTMSDNVNSLGQAPSDNSGSETGFEVIPGEPLEKKGVSMTNIILGGLVVISLGGLGVIGYKYSQYKKLNGSE